MRQEVWLSCRTEGNLQGVASNSRQFGGPEVAEGKRYAQALFCSSNVILRIAKSPNRLIAKSPDRQIAQSPNRWNSERPNFPCFRTRSVVPNVWRTFGKFPDVRILSPSAVMGGTAVVPSANLCHPNCAARRDSIRARPRAEVSLRLLHQIHRTCEQVLPSPSMNSCH